VVAIIFSTLSIFVSYFFAVMFCRDLNRLPQKNIAHSWFKLAVLFNAVSSIGAFSLAYMMATKNMHQQLYMSAVYFFLHFQYNGWFFFACMGLFTAYLATNAIEIKYMRLIFILFACAIVPAYLLSLLWAQLPVWLYIIVVLAIAAQLAGFYLLVISIKGHIKKLTQAIPPVAAWLGGFAAVALAIKLLLQGLSVIPSLNQTVFGFRPIVIGYLHLVFLGIVTLFIVSYCIAAGYISISHKATRSIYIFTAGIIINEVLLMLQGICDLFYVNIPFINQALLAAAVIMLAGITITVKVQFEELNYRPASKKIFTH
jgi:hypothetical protein